MSKTNRELQAEIKMLRRELQIKDERIEALDKSRANIIESCRILNKEQKNRIERVSRGASDINTMCNAIMWYLAKERGGEIRVPKDYMERFLICKPTYTTEIDLATNEYIFSIKRQEMKNYYTKEFLEEANKPIFTKEQEEQINKEYEKMEKFFGEDL